jgi:hypothetical protein
MDSVLAILIIPLLLAGLILVILNMLDIDISLTQENNSSKLDEHKASVAHTQMLNVDHNSSVGAHTNFDDKYMSSTAVRAMIDENNTSSSHKELIGSLVSSSLDSTLTSSLNSHNTSSSAHNLNKYSDLGNKLKNLEDAYNSHTHTTDTSVVIGSAQTNQLQTSSDLNWTPI